jgi:hypothetical protein
MRPSELLRHLVVALERMQVDYLITGSTATIYYGEPRFSNDIDVVVRGVLKVSGDDVDFDYVETWAERLGVADLWRRVRERAGR